MDVELTPARREDRPLIAHLMQLYAYDFSELMGLEVDDAGLFHTPGYESYWSERWYHPFLIRVGGHCAGFAVVDARSRIVPGETCWDMSEFFVLRRHRGAGVGARAAAATFDAFPGRWEVRQVPSNTPAQAFWRKVIDRYTGGRFREVVWDDARWRGPVQIFDSTRPADAG